MASPPLSCGRPRSGIGALVGFLALFNGWALASGPSPFLLKDPRGNVIDEEAMLAEPEPVLDTVPLAAERSLVPELLGGKRRGLFARLFGLPRATAFDTLETKYPVVLLHGANTGKVTKIGPITLRYFASTEAHLRRLNLRLLVPEVDPFGSIEKRALQAKEQILAAIPEGKFNLVCHSMGGLDARWLATHGGLGDRIASIATVATPHHGSWYADFADHWVFDRQGLRKLGSLFGIEFDQIKDLRVKHMEGEFNPKTPDHPGVKYYSYGTWCPALKSPPFYWGMNFIMGIAERRALKKGMAMPIGLRGAAGSVEVPREAAAAAAAAADAAPRGWIVPKWVGKNDGVVSLSSAVWGEYVGTIKAHHWGPMGWVTSFREEKLWEEVVRRLAADGF